jgi:hypothetical protein
MNDKNKDKKREVAPSKVGDPHQGPASTTEVTSAIGVTTNAGDKDRKTIDTGDISRASIAKGIRSPDGSSISSNVTAADIVKGTTKPEDTISYTTGISAANGKPLNAKTEASITKEPENRNMAVTNNTEEDMSKLVSSGTSSSKSDSIDKGDIYSSDDDGTRHLEKVQQETQTTTRTTKEVNDKEIANTDS